MKQEGPPWARPRRHAPVTAGQQKEAIGKPLETVGRKARG